MSVIEKDGLLNFIDKAGNRYLLYPITKAGLVDGLEEQIAELMSRKGFELMERSVPPEERQAGTLYGLILADYGGES